MNDWNSLECPDCGAEGAVHTIHSEDDHEINCQECDLIQRDDAVNCDECAEGE